MGSSWQGIARCGGNTLLPYMPVRRKGHDDDDDDAMHAYVFSSYCDPERDDKHLQIISKSFFNM